jgi:hypothetical protein
MRKAWVTWDSSKGFRGQTARMSSKGTALQGEQALPISGHEEIGQDDPMP